MTEKDKKWLLWGKDEVELDANVVKKKRDELVLAKGKKGTERQEQTRILQYLLDLATAANLGKCAATAHLVLPFVILRCPSSVSLSLGSWFL